MIGGSSARKEGAMEKLPMLIPLALILAARTLNRTTQQPTQSAEDEIWKFEESYS